MVHYKGPGKDKANLTIKDRQHPWRRCVSRITGCTGYTQDTPPPKTKRNRCVMCHHIVDCPRFTPTAGYVALYLCQARLTITITHHSPISPARHRRASASRITSLSKTVGYHYHHWRQSVKSYHTGQSRQLEATQRTYINMLFHLGVTARSQT